MDHEQPESTVSSLLSLNSPTRHETQSNHDTESDWTSTRKDRRERYRCNVSHALRFSPCLPESPPPTVRLLPKQKEVFVPLNRHLSPTSSSPRGKQYK